MRNERSPYQSDQLGYEDSFGKLIADSTSNIADISAEYDYNPERWRVHYDAGSTGTYQRRLIQYGDDGNFQDIADGHLLQPNAGDTMKMVTAESYRYVVQYVVRPSFSAQINQSLTDGDKVTIAFGEADLNNDMADANGWILEFEPSLADDVCYFSAYRDGEVTTNGGKRKKVQLERGLLNWGRYAFDLNWYNVGESLLTETYTDNGTQENPRQASISSDNRKGPSSAIQPVEFSVRAGQSTSNLEFEVGSVAFIVLGDTKSLLRTKTFSRTEPLNTTGAWSPIFAMRIPPDKSKVFTALESLTLLNFSTSDTIRLHAQAFDPSKVTFEGTDSWSTPIELNPINTYLETRTDVTQFPDSSGTIVSSSQDLGGWQIGASVLSVSNLQGSSFNVQPAQQKTKRPIYGDDVIVILARSEGTGDVSFDLNIRQDF